MNKDHRQTFSEEFLNSFVDNQLTAEEKSQAYLEIGQDQDLNRQVCELRKMHDLVQLAYQNVPPPPAARPLQGARRRAGWGVAAAIALALGVVLGTQVRLQPVVDTPVVERAPTLTVTARPALVAPIRQPAPAVTPAVDPAVSVSEPAAAVLLSADNEIPPRAPLPVHGVKNKVLIHIADNKPAQLASALDEIESLMRHYRDTQQTAHVEVVMNGAGLDLVRTDTAPYAGRVAELQRQFHNLTFAACQNTIDRLKREQNITVRLLPGVIIIDSGMAEIMRRQNQGWTYLQV